MRSQWKFLLSFPFWIVFSLSLSGCSKALYISGLGWHQAYISFHSVPIEEMLDNEQVAPNVQEKIRFVQEVKRYGETHVGLTRTRSYSRFYELKGPVLYVVTASEKDQLQPYHWTFPIVGKVAYKGFFTKEEALREQRGLDEQGYDTYLRPSEAYSTLGWLRDPIFSTMLEWDDGNLANLILHEMTHTTVYFKGKADFNEQMATFVGNQGAVDFLAGKYGPESREVVRAVETQEDDLRFSLWIDQACQRLSRYYSQSTPKEEKLRGRKELFSSLEEEFRGMQPLFKTKGYRNFGSTPLNNAVLLAHRQYFHRQEAFQRLYAYLGQDLKRMIEWIKTVRVSEEDPGAYLDRWMRERS